MSDPRDRKLTDSELAKLFTDDFQPTAGPVSDDPTDALHRHFAESRLSDWCEVSDEGCRVLRLMGGEVEEYSPLEAVNVCKTIQTRLRVMTL